MEENNKFSSNILKISTIAPSNSNKSKEPSEEFKLSKKLTMVNKNKNDTNSLILLDNITDKNSSSLVKKNTLCRKHYERNRQVLCKLQNSSRYGKMVYRIIK